MSGAEGGAGRVAAVQDFYDAFAAAYEVVYGGEWEAAVAAQGTALDGLVRDVLGGAGSVLDCSCGIGTQAIGMSLCGYHVHGTDLSARAVERARREARRLGSEATFGVADFRDLSAVPGTFDVVLSCDNALPHLLEEAAVRQALTEMRRKLRPGGLLVVTTRDYDTARVRRPDVAPAQVVAGQPRRVLVRLQEWEAHRPVYTIRFLVLTETAGGWEVAEYATRYRAVTRRELSRAARRAGLTDVRWLEGGPLAEALGQQVLTARNGEPG